MQRFLCWTSTLLLGLRLADSLVPLGKDELIRVYFGAGAFWYVQHELIHAEMSILHRNSSSVTAVAGYAGSAKPGPYCFRDKKNSADVVALEIPASSLEKFAAVYFSLFVGTDRSHRNDEGSNFRSAIGLPGGLNSTLMKSIHAAHESHEGPEFTFMQGLGGDDDTIGFASVLVYDSDVFPVQQAEIYNQFHDDYLSTGDYPPSYTSLRTVFLCSKKLLPTGCLGDHKRNWLTHDCSDLSRCSCPQSPLGGNLPADMDIPVDCDCGSKYEDYDVYVL